VSAIVMLLLQSLVVCFESYFGAFRFGAFEITQPSPSNQSPQVPWSEDGFEASLQDSCFQIK